MASYSRLRVLKTIIQTGLVPVFYTNDPENAAHIVRSCKNGGVPTAEFTNRGPAALSVFQHLRQNFPDVILGVGSVVDAPTAALFIAHGADFIVGPSFNPQVADLCNRRKIAYMPGCGTLTEIQTAEAAGAEIVKLFPANTYGPEFVKAVLGPCPWTRIMPTGGVDITEDSIKSWFQAGVSCVGIGSNLTRASDITQTCKQVLSWIQKYRKEDDIVTL